MRFVEKCKRTKVNWAIFSDRCGVWLPHVEHEWYEKDPNTVAEAEFKKLVKDFDEHLRIFDEILFYHNPARFHPLYRKLLCESALLEKVRMFTHLSEIV